VVHVRDDRHVPYRLFPHIACPVKLLKNRYFAHLPLLRTANLRK
jgi:hypothetical protein